MTEWKVHSEEFNRSALKLAGTRDSIGAGARELGIERTLIRHWKARQAANPDPPSPVNENPHDVKLTGLTGTEGTQL